MAKQIVTLENLTEQLGFFSYGDLVQAGKVVEQSIRARELATREVFPHGAVVEFTDDQGNRVHGLVKYRNERTCNVQMADGSLPKVLWPNLTLVSLPVAEPTKEEIVAKEAEEARIAEEAQAKADKAAKKKGGKKNKKAAPVVEAAAPATTEGEDQAVNA
jgi:hypothetical protein